MDLLARGIDEIALVGDPAEVRMMALLAEARKYRPGAILALSPADVSSDHAIPLLSYRTMKGGAPTVYVCRHFTCQMPVTTAEEMRGLLR
jgi:hypothetical protein